MTEGARHRPDGCATFPQKLGGTGDPPHMIECDLEPNRPGSFCVQEVGPWGESSGAG